jgi:hypothetical protein
VQAWKVSTKVTRERADLTEYVATTVGWWRVRRAFTFEHDLPRLLLRPGGNNRDRPANQPLRQPSQHRSGEWQRARVWRVWRVWRQ